MASEGDSKHEDPPQSWKRLKTAIRIRLSVCVGTAIFIGWVFLRNSHKKQRSYESGNIQEAVHHSGGIEPGWKFEEREEKSGVLSLVSELLRAVAVRLIQHFFKAWRPTLVAGAQEITYAYVIFSEYCQGGCPNDCSSLSEHSETL
jgi:hypothetical protein